MSAPAETATMFAVTQPYPGLRPFEPHEAFLFYGRETHTHALLERLATERFLAVVGSSGGGKSSLVRAGLLPALYRGYLVGASSRWRIAVMRPGNAPLDALAGALADKAALGLEAPRLREICGRTSLGLTEAIRQAELATGENVLLVIDQFEELFRFAGERRREDGGAEANLFVQSVIEATDAYQGRLFVVVTMRSDYLGDCAQFAGLPEALNRGQYLIPHLTREQRRAAIEQPPLLAGVRIKPALVQRVLNDVGDDPSQLPVLQHALMRTFRCLHGDDARELDFVHYEASGGVEGALDRHANEIRDRLDAPPRAAVEKLFRCLTTIEGRRAVRRPARLDRIYRVLGVESDQAGRAAVDDAISAFALPENSLLVSSTGLDLRGDSVIDISHESLIGKWTALADWRVKETRSAEWYESVATDARRYRVGESSLWSDPELARALELKADGWNEAWALQYDPAAEPPFDEVLRFLDMSIATQEEDRAQKEARRRKEIDDAHKLATAEGRAKKFYGLSTALLLLFVVGLMIAGYLVWRQHELNLDTARRELELASSVSRTAAAQEALKRQLERASDELARSQASGTASGALMESQRQKIAELEARVAVSTTAATKAQQDQTKYQQIAPATPKSEYTAAFKEIADLQSQLKQAREERDNLRHQIDTTATIQVRDAAYWKNRYETAEAAIGRLRAEGGSGSSASTIVAAVVLPLNSSVRVAQASLHGVIFSLLAGRFDKKTRPSPWLYVTQAPYGAPGLGRVTLFEKDDDRAVAAMKLLGTKLACPGEVHGNGEDAWCFEVKGDPSNPAPQPQLLGQVRWQSETYALEAAWAQWGVLSISVRHVARPPEAAK